MARPSVLSPELRETIERELEDGIPVAIVAQHARVSKSSLHSWISAGRVARRRRRDPLKLVPEIAERPRSPESGSPDSLEERLRHAEEPLVAEIMNAATRGSWTSAAWLLERIAPERWAKPTRTRTLEIGRGPLVADPFAEIDEIAARRRRKLER